MSKIIKKLIDDNKVKVSGSAIITHEPQDLMDLLDAVIEINTPWGNKPDVKTFRSHDNRMIPFLPEVYDAEDMDDFLTTLKDRDDRQQEQIKFLQTSVKSLADANDRLREKADAWNKLDIYTKQTLRRCIDSLDALDKLQKIELWCRGWEIDAEPSEDDMIIQMFESELHELWEMLEVE